VYLDHIRKQKLNIEGILNESAYTTQVIYWRHVPSVLPELTLILLNSEPCYSSLCVTI